MVDGDGDETIDARSTPLISVIIPVYNDPEGIKTTLESVVDQTYPAEHYEVLVIDNGSTDTTLAIAEEIASRRPHVHVLQETEIQSSYAARNRGIKHASGTYLAFIDADMSVESDWLETLSTALEQADAKYFGCNVEIYKESNGFAAAYDYHSGFPIQAAVEQWNFAQTCGLVVHRDVFDDVGLFDERLVSGGDSEFGRRAHEAGFDQRYIDEVTLYHPARTSIRSLVQKSLRMGVGKSQQRRYHPDRHRPLYDPRNFLPAHPLRYHRRLRDSDSLPFHRFVLFYWFKYLLKICKISRWGVETIRYKIGR